MTIVLDHTVVRARDKQRSAAFLAALLDLPVGEGIGPFVPVRVNAELTLDFDDRHEFAAAHYAFKLDEHTFDALAARLAASPAPFGSGLEFGWDRRVSHVGDQRRVYVLDPDGHSYEFFTGERID